jgi:hypothetical protein
MVITSEQSRAKRLALQETIRIAKKKIRNEVKTFVAQKKLVSVLPKSFFINKMILKDKSKRELDDIIDVLQEFSNKLDIQLKPIHEYVNNIKKQKQLIDDDIEMISDYHRYKYESGIGIWKLYYEENDFLQNTENYQSFRNSRKTK